MTHLSQREGLRMIAGYFSGTFSVLDKDSGALTYLVIVLQRKYQVNNKKKTSGATENNGEGVKTVVMQFPNVTANVFTFFFCFSFFFPFVKKVVFSTYINMMLSNLRKFVSNHLGVLMSKHVDGPTSGLNMGNRNES
jgi:hypothetical protein